MDLHNTLNNKLPKHAPDPDIWARIEDSLNTLDAETQMQLKLAEMPMHRPDGLLWQRIEHRLGQRLLLQRIAKFTSAAAAILIFIFALPIIFKTVNTIDNQTITNTKSVSNTYNSEQVPLAEHTKPSQNTPTPTVIYTTAKPAVINPTNKRTLPVIHTASAAQTPIVSSELASTKKGNLINVNQENNSIPDIPVEIAANHVEPTQNSGPQTEIIASPISTGLNQSKQNVRKYITPSETKTNQPFRNLGLAMSYHPETMYNGEGNSMFHNLDLTASYNKEKVRFTTSIGMAYNSEQFELAVNFDKYQPVTGPGPNGTTDTISYTITNFDSELTGTEKHEYLTYGFGVARKIFKIGKLSSWFNAGAGVGVKLNTVDIKKSTTKMLESKYNAEVNSISVNQPVYNPWNLNITTGIDFNYQVLKKLSITFAPISRWYFKPVLMQNNQATDEFTMGFRTGMKLDF